MLDLEPGRAVTDVARYGDHRGTGFLRYNEARLYSEQKGYTFVPEEDTVVYQAGMRFTNLAEYQTVHLRIFDEDGSLMYQSRKIKGRGEASDSGPFGKSDYYMFKELGQQLLANRRYSFVFVIVCPYTREFMAEYPLYSSLDFEYGIDGFGSGIYNIFQYQPDPSVIEMPKDSDLYAPFVRICYLSGDLSTLPTTLAGLGASGPNRRRLEAAPTSDLSLDVEACFGGVKSSDAESVRHLLETEVALGARVDYLGTRRCRLSTGAEGWTFEFRVWGSNKDATSWEEVTKRLRLKTRLQTAIFQKLGLFAPIELYQSK